MIYLPVSHPESSQTVKKLASNIHISSSALSTHNPLPAARPEVLAAIVPTAKHITNNAEYLPLELGQEVIC